MTGPLQHARTVLKSYDSLSHKTVVECRCGWWKTAGSRFRAEELYREHKKEASK